MNITRPHDEEMQSGCDGLCLRLDAAQIKALGLGKQLPADGARVSLRASATVRRGTDAPDADGDETGDSPEQAEHGEGAKIELEITRLEFLGGSRKPADQVLYGSGD